jgi:glyoxylase-like metal-dependent hydrolase (beta-lactamase superfamily II)
MMNARTVALAALAVAALSPMCAARAQAAAAPDAWLAYEKLVPRAMWIDKVKDGLYVIRGPIRMDCMRGCRPGERGDGVLHEAGDVAVRVTPEGVILVDSKFPEMVDDILALVRTVTDKPVKYLLNSHYHNDHASGDSRLIAMGVTVVQQRYLRERYEVDKLEAGSASIAFGDYASVHLGGVVVEAYNFAPGGHTRGDVISYFPDLKVVHMGDLVIEGMPHIDYRGGGGSAVGFVNEIHDLLKLDFDVAIPGHGRLMTKDEVYAYVRKVEVMNERMKDAIRRGVPADKVVPELGLESLGWARSASTATFLAGDVPGYYAEMSAVLKGENAPPWKPR